MRNSFISSFENNGKYQVKKIHIIVFMTVIIGSLAACECLNRYFITHLSDNFKIYDSFLHQHKDTEILFLGDSHFIHGIDPTSFPDQTFNLSFSGASYIQSYYLLKHFIPEMSHLKLVILPLDLHSMSSFRGNRINVPSFWNRFIEYPELVKYKGLPILKNNFCLTLLSEEAGRGFFLKNLFTFLYTAHGNIEKMPRPGKLEINQYLNQKKALLRADYHFKECIIPDDALFTYFDKIITLCRDHSISVVTLQTPVSQFYLDQAQQYISIHPIITDIYYNHAYDKQIMQNLNYLEYYLDRSELFMADGDHLNRMGKSLFSKVLSRDIEHIITIHNNIMAKK
ncbi:MAG: hypothetical protein JW860_00930 [Sedimentisphaerales bacterium]|nr:hypothetical protein [Sedimentisphaerales bacterium]